MGLNTDEKQKTSSYLKVNHGSSHQHKYLSKLLSSFYEVYTNRKTVAYMKLIVKLWSNAAKNEKLFLGNSNMLATNFHITDRKVSIGYWQRKSPGPILKR